MAQIGCALRFS